MSSTSEPVVNFDLPIVGMTCAACAVRLEKVLGKVDGVVGAEVNYATGLASLRVSAGLLDREYVVGSIERAGFDVPENVALLYWRRPDNSSWPNTVLLWAKT